MSTTIQIRVKNESLMTKMSGLTWFVRVFQKSKINAYIDGQKHELVASKEPYKFTVSAGTHTLKLEDPRSKGKKRGRKIGNAIVGATIGLGLGGGMLGGALGAMDGISFTRDIKDGFSEMELAEGSTLAIVCKSNSKGEVKVKAEK